MPYKCTNCGITSNDKTIDNRPCSHEWVQLHKDDRSHGDTGTCPECGVLRNRIMQRQVNGREVYCCADCAMRIRAKPGQFRANEPPSEAPRYELDNPEPGKVYRFGPNDTPILSDTAKDK